MFSNISIRASQIDGFGWIDDFLPGGEVEVVAPWALPVPWPRLRASPPPAVGSRRQHLPWSAVAAAAGRAAHITTAHTNHILYKFKDAKEERKIKMKNTCKSPRIGLKRQRLV